MGVIILAGAILSVSFNKHAVQPVSNVVDTWNLEKTALNHQIEGYSSLDSIIPGQDLALHVSCVGASYLIDVYRMGYYGGSGAARVTSVRNQACHPYSMPKPDKMTGLVDANWPVSSTIQTTGRWQPGIYLAKLTASTGYQSYIPFTVRSPQVTNKLLFIHADNTDEAYNEWGGNSLYTGSTPGLPGLNRAVEVSFDRPFQEHTVFPDPNGNKNGSGNFLFWEYPMIKFLDKYGYKVDYATDVDIDRNPDLLLNYRAVIIAGHDEYWTLNMEEAYLSAIKHGTNLAIFGANTAYRPIRYQSSRFTNAPRRIIVDYKNSSLDPLKKISGDNVPTPVSWRAPPLNMPETDITGLFWGSETADEGTTSADLTVHDDKSWIFKGTGLKNGDRIKGLVGYEFDTFNRKVPQAKDVDLVFQTSLVNSLGKRQDAFSGLYTYPGGGRVFDAGTIQWAWGLDPANTLYSPQLVTITQNILNKFSLLNTTY